MRKKRMVILLLSLCLVSFQAGCGGSTAGENDDPETSPHVGYLAPDFSLTTPDGSIITLSSLRGNGVFINFWATFCEFCVDEIADMQSIYETYSNSGLMVLGINQEGSIQEVADFANQLGTTFPLLIDRASEIGDLYEVSGLPYSFFIDKDGFIRSIYIGQMTRDDMDMQVQLILP